MLALRLGEGLAGRKMGWEWPSLVPCRVGVAPQWAWVLASKWLFSVLRSTVPPRTAPTVLDQVAESL